MTDPYAERRNQLRKDVARYYAARGRHDLPWRQLAARRRERFYMVWISEMMLQQTGVSRVLPQFASWMSRFPDLTVLAEASLGDVLRQWQGLGYNRRAKYIWETARMLDGKPLPRTVAGLLELPGIGLNTAKAILVYTDNLSEAFIETNIRSVILDALEPRSARLDDAAILGHVKKLVPARDARHWYWAMMDYGAHLKRRKRGHLSRAASYSKQSAFAGSPRQVRGMIIRLLAERNLTAKELQAATGDVRTEEILKRLLDERLVDQAGRHFCLPG